MTDTEKRVEKEKKPAGATMFSFAGFGAIALFVGLLLNSAVSGEDPNLLPIAPIAIVAALIIGAIQRTTTDKEVTWYKTEARIIGAVIGFVFGFFA